jgi:hypothetical protein
MRFVLSSAGLSLHLKVKGQRVNFAFALHFGPSSAK